MVSPGRKGCSWFRLYLDYMSSDTDWGQKEHHQCFISVLHWYWLCKCRVSCLQCVSFPPPDWHCWPVRVFLGSCWTLQKSHRLRLRRPTGQFSTSAGEDLQELWGSNFTDVRKPRCFWVGLFLTFYKIKDIPFARSVWRCGWLPVLDLSFFQGGLVCAESSFFSVVAGKEGRQESIKHRCIPGHCFGWHTACWSPSLNFCPSPPYLSTGEDAAWPAWSYITGDPVIDMLSREGDSCTLDILGKGKHLLKTCKENFGWIFLLFFK